MKKEELIKEIKEEKCMNNIQGNYCSYFSLEILIKLEKIIKNVDKRLKIIEVYAKKGEDGVDSLHALK